MEGKVQFVQFQGSAHGCSAPRTQAGHYSAKNMAKRSTRAPRPSPEPPAKVLPLSDFVLPVRSLLLMLLETFENSTTSGGPILLMSIL